MVDNIRIRFERGSFSGKLDPSDLVKISEKYIKYEIKNTNQKYQSKIVILQSRKNGYVYIYGSLRKWYFGETSLLDFNQRTFVRALQKLAEVLQMPMSDLCDKGKITGIEIGMNIRTRISCLKLLRKLVSYKFFHREDDYQKQGSVYFGFDKEKKKNSSRTIIAYDKFRNIVKGLSGTTYGCRMKKAFECLKKHGYHITRIEIKLKGQQSIRAAHLYEIRNLDELIKKWELVYYVWTYHVSIIIVFSKIKIVPQMKRNERIIAEMLQSGDFCSVQKELLSNCSSKTYNGLKSKRSRIIKTFRETILKYGTFNDYNTDTFRSDVAKTLIRVCRKENNINVAVMIRNLWSKSYVPYNKDKK